MAFQYQQATSQVQNMQSAIGQEHESIPPVYQSLQIPTETYRAEHQPIPPVYQSVQNVKDTYSSLSPNTKLPPKPAVLASSGPYEDLQEGTSHKYQSLGVSC